MLPLEIALTLATEPFDATAVATSPGTPHDPPSAQARDPGGFEMALAISPPIGKYVPAVPPVPMRKKVMSCPRAGMPPNTAAPTPPSSAALRLINMEILPDWTRLDRFQSALATRERQLTPIARLIVGPISAWITMSAVASWSVGSRLTITSFAPWRLAMPGNAAAG